MCYYGDEIFNAFPNQNTLFRKIKGMEKFDRRWNIDFFHSLKEAESEKNSIKASINQFINNSNELPIPGMCFVCQSTSDPEIKIESCVVSITGPVIKSELESGKQIVEFLITMEEIRQTREEK